MENQKNVASIQAAYNAMKYTNVKKITKMREPKCENQKQKIMI